MLLWPSSVATTRSSCAAENSQPVKYIPGYRKVPGVIYARRYRVHEGTSGYTTVYEFESTAVPESTEWKEQQQNSSPKSPRMRQAMTHAPGSAGVYTRIDP